jgi:hypothetical protein
MKHRRHIEDQRLLSDYHNPPEPKYIIECPEPGTMGFWIPPGYSMWQAKYQPWQAEWTRIINEGRVPKI